MMRPPLTTSITGPVTTSSASFFASIVPHAFSYCARFFERIRRPSLSSLVRTRASTCSPSDTTSWGSTSLRIDSSLVGMTPSDLYPMSRSTSSESIFTTVPLTRLPSSNSTIVASIASANEPSRSSTTTWVSSSNCGSPLSSVAGSVAAGAEAVSSDAASVAAPGSWSGTRIPALLWFQATRSPSGARTWPLRRSSEREGYRSCVPTESS